jgi:ABC-type uncharacterized transport system substrate-binding protein
MKRPGLAFLVIVLISILAAPFVAQAQQPGKIYRIGLLRADGPVSTWRASYRPFLEGLRELGYVAGSNVVFEVRSAEGKYERLPALAADLVERGVDVFFAAGDEKILALKQATSTIPIVMNACDALEVGFVSSLARPGGNLTGVTCISGDLAVKRLELLKEVVPRMSRVAVSSRGSPCGTRSGPRAKLGPELGHQSPVPDRARSVRARGSIRRDGPGARRRPVRCRADLYMDSREEDW